MKEYEVSKLCNVLFSRSLAAGKAGAGVVSSALHPGVVASDAWRRLPWPLRPLLTRRMLSVQEGAKTTLHCATSDAAGAEDGLYYDRCAPREPSALARDPALAEALWQRSEAWVAAFR
jgi:NAD(P)-dependent dehydrogenase (short-subunit alcohol dehydrogenase family)